MTMPKFHELFTDVLTVLDDGAEWHRLALRDAVIERLNLTASELSETMPGGGLRISSRVHWAIQYLAVVRAVERPRRGLVKITDRGRLLLKENPAGVLLSHLKAFPEMKEWDERSRAKRDGDASPAASLASDSDAVPMEQIEGAIAVLRATVRQDLLDRLREEAPDFLEQAVLKVLHAMGYGASTDDLEHLGGAGDEGVDGLIRQDKLGLEQIYVQAKRYAADNTIGRPHLQQFVGALAGKSASRGVFITTSSFSKEARLFAHGLQNQKVILLDGEEFADLMIDYEVGVGVRHVIKTYEVDANFFEAE
jgi:restriction system protein